MSDAHYTRLVRQLFQKHRQQRRQPRTPFPSREWLEAAVRLVELQRRMYAKKDKAEGEIDEHQQSGEQHG